MSETLLLLRQRISRRDTILVGVVFLGSLLALSALLRANVYYIDDIGRSFRGYGWSESGRPLASWLMGVLSGESFLLDLSPLSQIMAVFFMSASAYILVRRIWGVTNDLVTLFACFLITLNPYLLQVYSYRYDSLPYSLGVLCAVMALLTIRDPADGWIPASKPLISGALLILCSLCLYQPTTGFFFVGGAELLLTTDGAAPDAFKPSVSILTSLALITAIALAIYKPLAMLFVARTGYIGEHSATSLSKIYSNIIANTTAYFDLIARHWFTHGYKFGILFGLIAFAAGARLVSEWFSFSGPSETPTNHRDPRRLPVLAIKTGALAFLVVGGTLSLQLILDKPVLLPRTFIAFGAVLAALSVYGLSPAWKKGGQEVRTTPVTAIAAALPIFWLAALCLAYGNGAAMQERHNAGIVSQMAQDVFVQTGSKKVPLVRFIGSPARAPQITEKLLPAYPLLDAIIMSYPRDDWYWGYEYVRMFGLRVDADKSIARCPLETLSGAPTVVERRFYEMKAAGDCILIRFK